MWLVWSGIRVAGLSGACDYSVELPHLSYCSWFDVCWSFGVVGLEGYPCCRLMRVRLFMVEEARKGRGMTELGEWQEIYMLKWQRSVSRIDHLTKEISCNLTNETIDEMKTA